MSNQLQTYDFNTAIAEIEYVQKMTASLMKTSHYAKMGELGVFAIVQKSISVGLNTLDALNGGMYYVGGKVELAAMTMNMLIRSKGHSIMKDPKSNAEICILHGKRADNGDTWTVSFSIKDAKQAGIYKATWEKYGEDMLFARALSRLARQLFPDVVRGCYVSGEISSAIEVESKEELVEEKVEVKPETISSQQANDLFVSLQICSDEFQKEIQSFCKKGGISDNLEGLPMIFYGRLKAKIEKEVEECKAALQQEQAVGE